MVLDHKIFWELSEKIYLKRLVDETEQELNIDTYSGTKAMYIWKILVLESFGNKLRKRRLV